MDEADYAQIFQQQFLEGAIKKQREGRGESLFARTSPESGICLDCDEAIPMKRLLVAPHALRCIGCQTEYERGIKRG